MILMKECFPEAINSPVRKIGARVELFEGSTLINIFQYTDALKSFTVERVGEESKFFGFGVCQRLNVKLIDKERKINITTANTIEIEFGVGCEFTYPYPAFYVTEVHRDENTNELSITAYDRLYAASAHTVSELDLPAGYDIKTFATACASYLGLPLKVGRNLLDLSKCYFGYCALNEDGSITSDFSDYYYSYVRTTALNDLLINSLGKYFTFSIGTEIPDKTCSIIIFGTRNGVENTWQEINSASNKTTIQVAEDFSEITQVELRWNRSSSAFADTTTTIPYLQFEEGSVATSYEPYLSVFDTNYPTGANYEGTETIREALNDIAEATQTIYYINYNWDLVFKRPDVNGDPVLTVGKDKYFDLESKTNRRLATICSATELGDNVVSSSITESGTTQYVRDNPFWDMREDIDAIVENAVSAIGGMTINQFDCSWRGDFSLEIGDKIGFITKDDETVYSYVFNDSITYNGFLAEKTSWEYTDNDDESANNPSTLGEALKQTYAKVDKANKQIDIVVSDTQSLSQSVSALQLNTDSINASVKQMETNTQNDLSTINSNIEVLTNQVNATMSAEDIRLEIQTELQTNGVSQVKTATGFTFDNEGLTVSKSGSEMTTTITEDGMTVYRDNKEVLVADNTGVIATNLHANTYLIIGTNSRFEDYGSRTGCFWIG